MTDTRGGTSRYPILMAVQDAAQKIFVLALIATVGLYGYMGWGIFSHTLVNYNQDKSQLATLIQVVSNLSSFLNLSVILLLVSAFLVFYDDERLGVICVAFAAFLEYGLSFIIDTMFSTDKLRDGQASQMMIQALQYTAIFFFIPGILHVLWRMVVRVKEAKAGQDLANMKFGKGVKRTERRSATIGALANCWELPFCREAIRTKCPIFHARTKCWKERVGCMCEENIILVAMESQAANTTPQTRAAEGGFVPIGDLLATSPTGKRDTMPTRVGPRGVRIPDNPHINPKQKAERCRNCIIYNEHQRQKYKLLSPFATMIVPLVMVVEWRDINTLISNGITRLESMLSGLALTAQPHNANADAVRNVTRSLPIQWVVAICLTLVLMTMVLRFLEYCMFKIKI